MKSAPVGKLTGAFFGTTVNHASERFLRDAVPEKMKKTRIILVSILLSVVLLACLGFLGYFGVKTMRRSHLRSEARKAFSAEDWKTAEKLLNQYISLDPDSEEDIVRLAQVYRHFGNTDEEMQCWYRASALNPLKPEYWDTYTECALNARDFRHLYTTLGRKVAFNADLAPKDKMLYLICAVMTDRAKDAEQYYERMLKDSGSEVFSRDDFGRYAEFLVTYRKRSEGERSEFIEHGIRSDNPFVRLESLLTYFSRLGLSGKAPDSILEEKEAVLKQAVELNRFAATPILANFYFSQLRFNSVIGTAEPFLADIAHISLSVLYAESCVYGAQPEKLKPLAEKFRTLGGRYKLLSSYFDALYDFSQGLEKRDDLAKHMQEVRGVIQTDLATLIDLQIALNNDNEEKIVSLFETIMKSPPFCDLQERARIAVRHYLWTRIDENPDSADDPRIIKLAQLFSGADKTDPLLMRILISDQRSRNVLTRQVLQENLNAFPLDPYLLETAAEFELFNNNPEKCLEYVERFYALEKAEHSITFDFLHMLALELTGKIDEAAKEFTALVENHGMNIGVLYRYFNFCIDHERRTELEAMAERLDASNVPELKALAPFFRAEELFLQGKKDEGLSLLETAQTDHPDFALYAANKFSSHNRTDQALSRYLPLVGKHPDQRLILANIAELQMAKGKKAEALSYAKQAWETNHDDGIGQFVYAQMLAANGRYQDAEKVLTIPNRKVELPDGVRKLWTDIMLHCVQEDLEKGQFQRALDRARHYLIFFPDDSTFLDFRNRAEQELKKAQDSRNPEN